MACRCGPTVEDFLADTGLPPFWEQLDDLVWLDHFTLGSRYANLRGIIKPYPDLALNGPADELRKQLMDSYQKIVAILEECRVPFYNMPALEIGGKFHGCGHPKCDCTPGTFSEIQALVRIELVVT